MLPASMLLRLVKWIAITVAVFAALGVALASVTNWNALRGPIERYVSDKTGRELHIKGDLYVRLGWPRTRIRVGDATFANPPWATRGAVVAARGVVLDLSMPPLFKRRVVLDQVRLDRAEVYLEQSADGRKNWLLDREQRSEGSRVIVSHLTIRDGRIGYRDRARKTDLLARVSTAARGAESPRGSRLRFKVEGQYEGQALSAEGTGGDVLGLRDARQPYRFSVQGKIGPTAAKATGQVTDLLRFSAANLQVGIRGASLEQLFPLIGVVFPDTPPYDTNGRLIRQGSVWRYEKFHGHIGRSDISGTLQVDVGPKRPVLSATLSSTRLNLADLGPLIGTRNTGQGEDDASRPGKILPANAFRTERWDRMDADVTFRAKSIRRPDTLPIDNLSTRLRLRNADLTLDPLKFEVAGGSLAGRVSLNGQATPIKARADLKVRKISLARLFPTVDTAKASIGHFNGDIDLAGTGNTIAAMLGNANGQLAVVIDGGVISRLMMETVSLHLLEMLMLKLTGDEVIRIRCGVADFGVRRGVMKANALVLDTDIVRIDAGGTIDLGKEALDLSILPKPKKLTLVSLRTPIHVEGTFAQPDFGLDAGKLALRGAGAVALGLVAPVLALVPLIDASTGEDSECRRLIAEARSPG